LIHNDPTNDLNTRYVLFVVCGFLALFLLIEGAYFLWNDTRSPEVQRIQKRLNLMTTEERNLNSSTLSKNRVLSAQPALQAWLEQVPHIQLLDRLLLQAASKQNVAQHVMWSLVGAVLLGSLAGLMWGSYVAWPACVLGLLLPVMRLRWMRQHRLTKISAQLPDALDLICRSLRAGHAFSTCLAMVGHEAPEPIASEFKTTFDEITFGMSTKNALLNLAQRVPVADIRYLVIAVVIQLETGGNLTELLYLLSGLIRERFKLFAKVRVLAAEGKLSAYIMLALPFFVGAALQVVNPKYISVLFESEEGMSVVSISLLMMALGMLWMWRVVKIKV
jgi:tight adherence protein B